MNVLLHLHHCGNLNHPFRAHLPIELLLFADVFLSFFTDTFFSPAWLKHVMTKT